MLTSKPGHRPSFLENLRTPLLVILAGAFLVPLLAHADIGRFNRYLADDYCVANVVRAEGVRGAVEYWYLNWHGSILFDLFASLGGLLPASMVRFWPVLALSSWALLLVWTLWQLPLATRRWDRVLVSVVLAELTLAVLLDGPPHMVPQSVYWLDGALRYMAPQLFLVAYVGVVACRLRKATGRQLSPAACGLAGVLALSAGLFSETHMAAQTTGLMLGTLACALLSPEPRRARVMPLLYAGLGGTLLAVVITVVAPGTMVRQGLFPDPPDVVTTGLLTLGYTRDYLADVAVRAPWSLVLTALTPALLAWLLGRSERTRDRSRVPSATRGPWLIAIPCMTAVVLAATFAPTAWAASSFPPVRSLLVSQTVLFGGLATWSYLVGQCTHVYIRDEHVVRLRLPLVGALLLTIIWPLHTATRIHAWRAEADAYARTWEIFDLKLRQANAQGLSAARLPAPENFANLETVGSDAGFWVNGCVSAFYGLSVTGFPPPSLPSAADLNRMNSVEVDVEGIATITDYRVHQVYAEPGEMLSVTVQWLPRNITEIPHGVFMALNGPNGQSISQSTTTLTANGYDTTVWAPGRSFLGTYAVEIPRSAESTRDARLVVGLYNPSTLQQLPLMTRGVSAPDRLATVTISDSGCGPRADDRDAAHRRADAELWTAVTGQFDIDPVVGPLHIEVGVYDSVVSLCDDDTSGAERERAVEIVRLFGNVTDVVDRMK